MQGKTLGTYRIESELGSGGMGTVWLATDEAGDRYAVKVIHPHLLESPGFFKRFLREAEIGRAIQHPNVVGCHDADAVVVDGEQRNFLVMEYVEGQSLRELQEELGTVPEELCRHIGREVAKGLAAIHAAGVVHRDIKPENVLITPEHEIRIMDLGVARLADEAIRLSQSGAFVGSIHYAAPEQIQGSGRDLDGRADLHALGLILYELSSGAHPYLAEELPGILHRVLSVAPRRLGEIHPQLSPFFEEVTHTLLAKDREARFASAKDLLDVLEQGEQSGWWRGKAQSLRAETSRPLRRIRIPRETSVYGRENELGKLRAHFESAKAGDGRVVLIDGEAGIGKTRLVDEAIGRLLTDGEDLNFLFGSYPPGGAATAAGAWSTAYREQFGAEGLTRTLASYLTATPILVPAFAALLRGEPPPEGKEPLTKDSLQTVFVHATRALAAERTTVVLIEDLHFAPEEGRAMFASLALAAPGHRILLIGTTRPGIPEEWRANLERLEAASRMPLPRLGPKDTVSLLIDAFGSEKLALELGMRVAQKSDGNPFFVFEIIRGLREGQFIARRPDGTWISTRVIEEIEIPSSVQDLIQARIADLDEEEQELLDVAACCGFEFDPGLVADATGLAKIPALRRLGRIEKRHRLVRSAGDEFIFDHHQVQEALYDGISPPLRREYHAALGRALAERTPEPSGATAVELCEHLLQGALGEDAVGCFDAALDHLETSYQDDRAVALADRALECEGALTGVRRGEVLLGKATRLNRLWISDTEEATLEEARVIATETGDVALRTWVHMAVGAHLVRQARVEEALDEFRRARDLARASGDRRREGKAIGNMGVANYRLGHLEKAWEQHESHLAIACETGDRRDEAKALTNLGIVLQGLGQNDKASEQHASSLRLSREIGDRRMEMLANMNLGNTFLLFGRLENARERYERCQAIAREIGARWSEGTVLGNLGLLAMRLGRFEEAIDLLSRWQTVAREIQDRAGEGKAAGNLGLAFADHGRFSDARERYEEAIAVAREVGSRDAEGTSLVNAGDLHMRLGDLDEAEAMLGDALAIFTDIGAPGPESYARHGLAEVAAAAGEPRRARRLAEEALRLRREVGYGKGMAETLVLLGRLRWAEGDDDAARAHLEEGVALARDVSHFESIVLGQALLATLPGADPTPALEAFEEHGARVGRALGMEVRFRLWRATGDPAHLEEAHRLLERIRDHAPAEYRTTMIENVPLHRDIVAASAPHEE